MNIEEFKLKRVYRYETESGFAIESHNGVLPVFNADDKSVDWYEFPPTSLTDIYSSPVALQKLQLLAFAQDADAGVTTAMSGQLYTNFAIALHNWMTAPLPFDPDSSLSNFHIWVSVDDLILDSRRGLGKCERRIVDQRHICALLMAGQVYLVSQDEQERTEKSAKDHVTHLEFLTLSRDHSDSNLFSAAIHKLHRFAWRVLRKCISSSFRVSNCLARATRFGQLCPSFAVVFGPLN
jgi:hypothetical protein